MRVLLARAARPFVLALALLLAAAAMFFDSYYVIFNYDDHFGRPRSEYFSRMGWRDLIAWHLLASVIPACVLCAASLMRGRSSPSCERGGVDVGPRRRGPRRARDTADGGRADYRHTP